MQNYFGKPYKIIVFQNKKTGTQKQHLNNPKTTLQKGNKEERS